MKIVQLLSAAALSLGSMIGAVSTATAETRSFSVGEWAPYVGEALEGNGLHAERARSVIGAAGQEIALEFMPWKRSYELAKKGDFVGTFPWSYTEERAADFYYPETPIEDQTDVIFYSRANHPEGIDVTSIEEIAAKGLKAVGIGSYWYEQPFADAGVEFHSVNSLKSAWKMLQSGRADILIENQVVGDLSRTEVLGADAESIGTGAVLRTVPMYVLFSRAHPEGEAMRDAWDAHASQ